MTTRSAEGGTVPANSPCVRGLCVRVCTVFGSCDDGSLVRAFVSSSCACLTLLLAPVVAACRVPVDALALLGLRRGARPLLAVELRCGVQVPAERETVLLSPTTMGLQATGPHT